MKSNVKLQNYCSKYVQYTMGFKFVYKGGRTFTLNNMLKYVIKNINSKPDNIMFKAILRFSILLVEKCSQRNQNIPNY